MPLNKVYLESGKTAGSDECLTPRYAVEPIIKYLKKKGVKRIWCPFDLDHSHYVRVLKREGFEVINTHYKDGIGEDFFKYEPEKYDCIVSNGPFSIKTKVLKRCYELGKPFTLLFPQNSLQGLERVKLFQEYGIEYLGFDGRICFYTKDLTRLNKQNHFASGYFCWNMLPEKLIFENLEFEQESYWKGWEENG